MVHPGYRKRTIFLLVVVLLVRFWYGQTFELSGQEAYLWLQGHGNNLSPAYWERGPLVPFLIRLGTSFFGDTELGVRWLAAVICCASGFVIFYLARHWFDARTAFWAVVLFLVIPMFAWKLSLMTEAAVGIGLMALAMWGFDHAIESGRGYWWLLGGLACGLALLVAVSNVLWIVGVVLYFALSPARRSRLGDRWLWIAVVFTALFLAPMIWWWRGPQVADVAHAHLLNSLPSGSGFSFAAGFHFIGLEIFYLSPLFFLLLVAVLWHMGRELWESPRYALLLCLALPGLIWLNVTAFFRSEHFELIPALFLPVVLIAGCQFARLAVERPRLRLLEVTVIGFALVQSLLGLNPFLIVTTPDGHHEVRRTRNGDAMANFSPQRHYVSWRTLADSVRSMQQDQGATLLITDSPLTASALSFYLPHNPLVYVESRPNFITHFDFWNSYAQNASPNDSALFITHSTNPDRPADGPSGEMLKNFASVTPVPDPPLPEFDKSWDIWICQNFIGGANQAADMPQNPIHDTDALPK